MKKSPFPGMDPYLEPFGGDVPLQKSLPNIAISLRPTDSDIVLRLQPLLEECYRRGRYMMLDYTSALTPQLSGDDQLWVAQLLASSKASS